MGRGVFISGVWKNVSDVFDNIIINNKVGCFLKTCFSTGLFCQSWVLGYIMLIVDRFGGFFVCLFFCFVF